MYERLVPLSRLVACPLVMKFGEAMPVNLDASLPSVLPDTGACAVHEPNDRARYAGSVVRPVLPRHCGLSARSLWNNRSARDHRHYKEWFACCSMRIERSVPQIPWFSPPGPCHRRLGNPDLEYHRCLQGTAVRLWWSTTSLIRFSASISGIQFYKKTAFPPKKRAS